MWYMKRLILLLALLPLTVFGQPTVIGDDPVTNPTTLVDPTVTNNIIDKAFTGQSGIVFVVLVGIIAFLLFFLYKERNEKEKYIERMSDMAIKTNQVMDAAKNAYLSLNDKLDELLNK